MPRPARTSPRRGALAGATVLFAGCAGPLPVQAGPDAADPLCAEVVLALPTELGPLRRLPTGSQATTAWGDRAAPVVLRCGVEPPPPSAQCVTVTDGTVSVDWVADPGDGARWTFTTFGRDPVVEVVVPVADGAGGDGGPGGAVPAGESVLVELGGAVSQVPATQVCA